MSCSANERCQSVSYGFWQLYEILKRFAPGCTRTYTKNKLITKKGPYFVNRSTPDKLHYPKSIRTKIFFRNRNQTTRTPNRLKIFSPPPAKYLLNAPKTVNRSKIVEEKYPWRLSAKKWITYMFSWEVLRLFGEQTSYRCANYERG